MFKNRPILSGSAAFFTAACLIFLLCGGCTLFESGETLAAPVEKLDQRLVDAGNGFGFNLFLSLAESEPQGNLFISPAGIMTALAMTYNGAAGDTERAMAETMMLDQMTLEEVNLAFADLLTILRNPDPDLELAIANSTWAREGIDFYEDFIDRVVEYFGATAESLDFSRPDAADRINAWVSENTRGAIDGIVDPPIDPDTVLFLINTIYFKGEWNEPFDPELTTNQPFHLPGGEIINHPIMFRNDEFRYFENETMQIVELPYGQNSRVGMYIILPAEEPGLQGLYGELNSDTWQAWTRSLSMQQGQVGLPRFQFEYEKTLNDYLVALGMEPAFNEKVSDFSNMRPEPPNLFISEVKHKTFIEVNEEGTEAAAATSVEMAPTSAPPGEPFVMIADRPFFFAIADNMTGTILFMGSLVTP